MKILLSLLIVSMFSLSAGASGKKTPARVNPKYNACQILIEKKVKSAVRLLDVKGPVSFEVEAADIVGKDAMDRELNKYSVSTLTTNKGALPGSGASFTTREGARGCEIIQMNVNLGE